TIKIQQGEVRKLQTDKKVLEAIIETETAKADALRGAYASREILLQKAAELEKIVLIKSLQDNIASLSLRIARGNKACEDEEKKLESIKETLAALKGEITLVEQALPDTTLLVRVASWFNNKKQLEANLLKLQKETAEAFAKLSTAKGNIEAGLKQLPAQINLAVFPKSLSELKSKADELANRYNQQLQFLKDEQNHLELSQKLNEFAEALTGGAECPLCGSIHHPKVFSVTGVTENLKQKRRGIEEIENKKQLLNTALIHLSGDYSNYETYSIQYGEKQKEMERQQNELEKYTLSFSFEGYLLKDEELVKKQLAEIEERNAAIKKLRKQHDDKDKEAEETAKNLATYKAGIEKLKRDNDLQQGQVYALKDQILLLAIEGEISKTAAVLSSDAAAYKAEHARITKEFEHAEKLIQDNKTAEASFTGRLTELEKQLDVTVAQYQDAVHQIKSLLTKEGYQSEQQVEQVLATKLDVRKEREKVDGFRRELHAATIQLKEAEAKVEGKEYSEAVHIALQQTIQSLSKDVADKTEKLVTERNSLQQFKQQMEIRMQLQKDLDNLMLRA
ncbi:MAG TPA: hypothetical protein VF540_08665, partial [Segetibacter sp.]